MSADYESGVGRIDARDTEIRIEDLQQSFADGDETVEVFDGVSLAVPTGSFTTVMGPSGCGKTTLLNIIAGLIEPDGGTVVRSGVAVNGEGDDPFYPYVFQEPRLLDWETVRGNLEFVLKAQGVPPAEHDRRIRTELEKVGLADKADTYPAALSGGMQQRVGIARALCVDADVILMDEPFSALDELTAADLRADLLDLWRESDLTILFITHDLREAISLSDLVYFLDADGDLFHRARIDLDRPRSMEDPALLDRESELMNVMSGELDR